MVSAAEASSRDHAVWVPAFAGTTMVKLSRQRFAARLLQQIPTHGARRGAMLAVRLDDVLADLPTVHLVRTIDQPL